MTFLHRRFSLAVAIACVAAWAGNPVAIAQVTPSAPPSAQAPMPLSAAELETLVGPIALYPDDLVAIILPASTYPLHIVQASRFFDKRKANPKLQPDESWDDSLKSLLNYPDVVKKMSDDLEWTEALGEAVVTDSSAVLDAVQAFRRKVQAAGNLNSDARQVVVVEHEIIRLVPADPQIIYIPQYQPTAVVLPATPIAYYPTQYPVYHYPYPPGAALATGIIWGAALGAAWNGGHWGTNYGGGNNNITINRGGNTINTGNVNRAGTLPANTGAWKPSRQPGQVGRATTRPASTPRVGDAGIGGGGGFGGGAARPSTQPAGGAGMGGRGDSNRGGAQQGAGSSFSGGGRADGGAFGGMGSGGSAQQASMRGQNSRASGGDFGGGGARAGSLGGAGGAGAGSFGGGGGARAGSMGGGGGARAGGGARGGRR